ncbi:armadillo-type protein [Fimicolochytrium jonesii]|uniref:armadillo-type protein n=1 Tax=Fimicolochytrium jonesii TaxID=1396493 RepID=UPI0022FDC5EA|nr:armadillo-type protein [Fimicolochytrium jonesii]KAI8826801.1 armadillo-type protein [Fimicolochytrium jonesii]
MVNPTGPYLVASLLDKMSHHDPDYRWMATNDLMGALQSDSFQMEDVNEKKVVSALIKLLEDSNGEVQNVAVKCFAPLVKKIHENQLQEVVDQLCRLLTDKREDLRDIAGIGIKTVVIELPSDSPVSSKVVSQLVPKLLQQFSPDVKDPQLDVIDILSEILSRFGQSLALGPGGLQLQRSIKNTLFPILNHSRAAARKRATAALGHLVAHLSDELFEELVKAVLNELQQRSSSSDYDKLRTHIGCLAALSRYSSPRLAQHLDDALPLVFQYIEINDDELRENCLHALDSFVLRCPTEMTPHIPKVIAIALKYLKHDPNFESDEDAMDVDQQNGDEEEDGNDEDDDEDEEEEEDYEDDYSDEDDVSWKVRKGSSKLLASIIGTRSDFLEELLKTVAPALIARFKEREESVRVDVLGTFTTLIRQTGVATGSEKAQARDVGNGPESKRRRVSPGATDMVIDETPTTRDLLRQNVPRLSKILSKELKGKSVPVRQAGFHLLRELVRVLDGGLESSIGLFMPAIEISLATSPSHSVKATTNSNVKIGVLEFLRILFLTHKPTVFHKHLGKLVPLIVSAAQDKFYKITAEALTVVIELVKVIRPISYDGDSKRYDVSTLAQPQFGDYLSTIYETTLQRLGAADVDLEVKERSIIALGVLLSQAGDLLPADQIQSIVLPLLVDRLKNELTRLTTVRVIKSIAESPLAESTSTKVIDLSPVLPEVVSELASYLRKTHRQLRVASLQTLESLIRRYGKVIHGDIYVQILAEVRPLLSDSDLHILPLAINVISIIIFNGPNDRVLPVVKNELQPQIVRMIMESPHLLGAGPGLDSLTQLWQAIVRIGGSDMFEHSVQILLKPVTSGVDGLASGKQALSIIAQSLAILCLNFSPGGNATVQKFITEVEKNSAPENTLYVSLLTLGDVGRNMDLATQHESVDQIVLNLFASPSEDIKQAAAFALGNIALGNLKRYMPVVLQTVREGGKRRYLVLVSLKEIITRFSHNEASPESTAILHSFAPELWQLLFQNTEETAEETTRNAIAECLGKLSLSQPSTFLPDLQSRLSSPNAHARATVVTALRFTFTEHTQHDDFDSLLRPLLPQFLKLVKDTDLNVRRASLATLNSAAHNKPHLIQDSLPELLPLLYEETVVNTNLIHVVEMGPFKHQVDDGLDARKAAYECMYTLIETCLSRLDVFAFLQRVMSGLLDPSQDIKILSHLMLQRLSHLSPTAVAQKLDEMVEPLKTTLLTKTKSNAVKQEVEKTNELIRSAARTALILSKISDSGVSPRFVDFLKEIQSPQSPVAAIVAAEAQGGLLSNGCPVPMDLS